MVRGKKRRIVKGKEAWKGLKWAVCAEGLGCSHRKGAHSLRRGIQSVTVLCNSVYDPSCIVHLSDKWVFLMPC